MNPSAIFRSNSPQRVNHCQTNSKNKEKNFVFNLPIYARLFLFVLTLQTLHLSAQTYSLGGTTSTTSTLKGSTAGSTSCNCPSGQVVVGIIGNTGAFLDNIKLACRTLNSDGTLGSTITYTTQNGSSNGGSTVGPYTFSDKPIVGGYLRAGGNLDGVQLYGQTSSYIGAGSANNSSPTSLTFLGSTTGGSAYSAVYVPNGYVVTGMKFTSGTYASDFAFNYQDLIATAATPTTVNVSGGGSSCGGSVTLSASTAGAGNTIYWQTSSTGTSTTTSGSTLSVSSSGTWWARGRTTGGTWGSAGTSATVTINTVPSAVSVSGGTSACGSATVTLTASGGTGGTIYWQGTSSGGTSTTTASTSQSVTTSSTQTYYFNSRSSAGCWGTQGSATVTISTNPTASTSISGTTSICEGSSTTLSPVGGTNNYLWETGSCGGADVGTGSTLTVSPLVTTTYYLSRINGSCTSSCVSVTVTVTDTTQDTNLPTTYTGSITGGNSISSGNTATLSISGHSGTIAWQSSTNNTTFTNVGSSSATYTTAALSTTTYYRARVLASTCKYNYSNTNAVIVTPAPTGTTSPSITMTATALSVTNNTAAAVDPNLTMSFTGNLTGFTVTISQNYTSGDVLSYTGTLPSGVTTSGFNTQRRSITFSGTTSAANWQTFLRTVTIRTTSATCNPETRKVSFTASTNFYNYFNGHYYEYVSSNKNWTQARDYAASKSFYGRQGYLVVITTAEENAYISQMIGYNTWMGGTDNYKLINAAVGYTKYASQSASEGKYHWVTGPEKGVNFSNGNGSPSIPAGRYCRWQSGEPNNYNTGFYDNNVGAYGEHYMHIYADRKTWNDFPNDRYFASIIEYGDMPGDNPQGTVEGTRNITVNVPATGSVSGAATVCSGTNSTTLTLSGNAAGSTVARWESSPDNFLETTTTLSGTSTSYTVTNLTETKSFRAVVVNGSCTTVTTSVKITVVDLNAGDVIATTNQVCTGQNAILSLSGLVGTVQKWQTATNTGGPYTDIANTTTSLTRSISSAGTHYFRSVVNTSACSTSDVYSDWYSVVATTASTPTGGSVSSQRHCSSTNSGTLELTGATGTTYNWQQSTNNGSTWANTSPVTTGLTYTYANVSRNTMYRVSVGNGCNTVTSTSGNVEIYGTNRCQWIGGASTDWGTKANWCNDVVADNGSDFDISPDATYNLVLDRPRTVGTINFNGSAKYIYLGNFKLTVTDIEGADTANHVKTNGNGELRTSIATNDSFTFCVGAGTYNPVTITNKTGSTDNFTVRLIDNVYDRGSTGSALNTPRIKRTWFIDKIGGPASGGSGIDMSFNWYDAEISGTITNYRLYHYNGSNWDKQTAGSYAKRDRFMKYAGYTGTFSPFSMGDDIVLLPVNWLSINCERKTPSQAQVNWSTASETESDSFVVERTTGNEPFQRIGAVKAAGNSQTPRQYSINDPGAPSGKLFYRVLQTCKFDKGSYSEICHTLESGITAANPVRVYPNPADQNVQVVLGDGDMSGMTVSITNSAGVMVASKTAKGHSVEFPTAKLPAGLYIIRVSGPGMQPHQQKMVIQHP
jgi:hypothetical protein